MERYLKFQKSKIKKKDISFDYSVCVLINFILQTHVTLEDFPTKLAISRKVNSLLSECVHEKMPLHIMASVFLLFCLKRCSAAKFWADMNRQLKFLVSPGVR